MYGLQHGALAHTEQQAIKGPKITSVKLFKRENQRSNLYKKKIMYGKTFYSESDIRNNCMFNETNEPKCTFKTRQTIMHGIYKESCMIKIIDASKTTCNARHVHGHPGCSTSEVYGKKLNQ